VPQETTENENLFEKKEKEIFNNNIILLLLYFKINVENSTNRASRDRWATETVADAVLRRRCRSVERGQG